ncbi:hypothetical protein KW794_02045 [Candidatus Saccharibacteria bacterium]|nr:hypothetical protein [Candidatus Saccharibacteria bacterium]
MDVLKAPKKVKEVAGERVARGRQNAFNRFPLLFTLLATFGVVATFYGFEHMIDKVNWLANNPVITLSVGLIILFITGTLYKKL